MKGTQNVSERVSHLKWQNHCFMFFLSHFTVICGLLRVSMVLFVPFMVLCVLTPFMAVLWSDIASYGSFIVVSGLLWQNVELIRLVLPFLVVIDPNLFCLVYSWFHHKNNKNAFLGPLSIARGQKEYSYLVCQQWFKKNIITWCVNNGKCKIDSFFLQ